MGLLLLSVASSVPVPPPWPEHGAPLNPATVRKSVVGGPWKIFIDAGHGAPGNTGNESALCEDEEDFTLTTAKHLAAYLQRTGRFETRLSRDNGQRVSYKARLKNATAWSADAFVSIHSDVRGYGEYYALVPGKECVKNTRDPGFTVLFSDTGRPALVEQRRELARAVAQRMLAAGFGAYDGWDYEGLYDADPDQTGVFVDRHVPGQRIYFLLRPIMPSVIVETHHAWDPREVERWREIPTLDAFSAGVAAALLDALPVSQSRSARQ